MSHPHKKGAKESHSFVSKCLLEKIDAFFDKTIDIIGRAIAVLLLLMVFNVLYDVVMRYFFHNSSVGMQEMEWHLFSVVMMLGIGYTLNKEAHVRVDFLYDDFKHSSKAYINIFGTLFFILPLAVLIIYGSFEFVMDSYTLNEISQDPGGLPYRWIVKSLIPLGFIFLIYSSIGYIIKNILVLKKDEKC